MQGIKAGLLGLAFAAFTVGGCESSRPPPEPPEVPAQAEAPSPPPLDVFSGERAWADLLALTQPPEPEGVDPRGHLLSVLGELGLQVAELETPGSEEQGTQPLRHVLATLPGAVPDLFVLIAPYDGGGSPTPLPLGGNVGTSGAALLLELARVRSTRASHYTLRFVFLAGEGSAALPATRWRGSRDLVERMADRGELGRTRLLVAFDAVCDAHLRIARDLGSQRMFREEFFKAAKRIRREAAFPSGQAFEQVEASHRAFLDHGLRASVAIVGGQVDSDAGPGEAGGAREAPAGCVPESLEAVGLVTLEALDTIGKRLAKIDRFSRSPLVEIQPTPEPRTEGPPSEPGTEPEADSSTESAEVPGTDPATELDTPPSDEPSGASG